ncbi:MAG TPA: RelA/SpoT domain-containing protein [Candidatus Angelobacter sp.]|jgi:ppGpp synthetase/RelA/SpoT-type nucleotidyltranferase|nr:RelA/SpoT domain-containing protein [Candidatus Angelobacter sp.]
MVIETMPETDEGTGQQILKEYDAGISLFGDFKASCQRLVAELLRLEGVTVHSVHARVKERPKLQEKLGREGKNYRSLKDVTDIIGVRVITHFEDEVDKIGALIEREFVIDTDKSVDKRKLLDPDRFGYLSLHYICSLSQDRIRLAENRRFRELACEIQIRSILQHAWAEIEHDLGYKSGHGIPSPIFEIGRSLRGSRRRVCGHPK